MKTRRPLRHWVLLLSLVLMWGSSFLFTKIALRAFLPHGVVAARLSLAAVILAVLLLATRRRLPSGMHHWRSFAVLAVVGNVLPFWLISWGQQRIDSGLAGILMAVMPLTTVLLAHFFVDGEPLTRSRITGFVLGFSGIVVLTGPEALLELGGQGTSLVSELAVLAGAICYAVTTIVARRRPQSDSLAASAGVTLIAAGLMLPVALRTDALVLERLSWTPAVAVAFLGVISTALATVVYFRLIEAAGPSFMSLVNYLIPLWAVAVGFLFLGEIPEWSALAALGLILCGIALSERSPARQSA